MGNNNDFLLDYTRQIDAGTVLGPRVHRAGFLEGRSEFSARNDIVVAALEDGLKAVRWYADHGYRRIKIYNSMTPDWVAPIAAEAHRLGLTVSGHVPAFMTSERAIRDGCDEISHINQLMLSLVLNEQEDTRTIFRITAMGERFGTLDLSGEPVQRMVRLMQERGTTLDPTVALFNWLLLARPGKTVASDAPWLSHMPASTQRFRRAGVLDVKPGQYAAYEASWQRNTGNGEAAARCGYSHCAWVRTTSLVSRSTASSRCMCERDSRHGACYRSPRSNAPGTCTWMNSSAASSPASPRT